MKWPVFRNEFLRIHRSRTGVELMSRHFFWQEIRLYFRLKYTPEIAVDKYIGTKFRRAA